MAPIAITTSELLEALATASSQGPDGARTASELAAEAGIYVGRIRKALQQMHAKGRLVTHKVSRTDIGGRVQQVVAYTITPP